jgi:iron only hydrogenase large subunit-like protein
MGRDNVPDVDAVLTTRELGRIIRMHGLDLKNLEPEAQDSPFGERTTAGKIFGASGGVMEAAVRSAYFLITGEELEDLNIEAVRGFDGVKEAAVKIGDLEVKVAVASGLGNARKLLDAVRNGEKEYHFIEVMTCPGGCINGGGQTMNIDPDAVKARMKVLYELDSKADVDGRKSHKNPWITRLYEEYLGEPLGHKSHDLLHTHYHKRDVIK